MFKRYLLILSLCFISCSAVAQLSPQQLAEFYFQGIIVIPNFFSSAEVKQVTSSADRLLAVAEKLAQTQSGKIMSNGTQIVIDKSVL